MVLKNMVIRMVFKARLLTNYLDGYQNMVFIWIVLKYMVTFRIVLKYMVFIRIVIKNMVPIRMVFKNMVISEYFIKIWFLLG